MLNVKKFINWILQALPYTVRTLGHEAPITTNQTSPWTYTCPKSGMLYLNFISNQRAYCGISIDNNTLGAVALNTGSMASSVVVPILVGRGDVVRVSNLTANCYLSTSTAFKPFAYQPF